MADEPGTRGQEPDLELPPLLGFGRKKKRRPEAVEPDEVAPEELPDASAEDPGPLAADPVPPPAGQPRGGLAPATGAAKRLPPVPPPVKRPEVTDPDAWSRPVSEPWSDPTAEPATEDTQVLPSVSVAPQPTSPVGPPPAARVPDGPTTHAAVADPLRAGQAEPAAEPAPEPAVRRSRSIHLPPVSPRLAVLATGAVVGLSGVLLAYAASRGCEAVRGVGGCGGLGVLALLAITAIEIVLGAVLLTAFRLADATSTSFLGVGLAAVFVLLFLLGRLESPWMLLVIPVLTALMFLLSLWVSTTFVDVPEKSEPLR